MEWRHQADATVNWAQAANRGGRDFHETTANSACTGAARRLSLFGATGADEIESVLDRKTVGAYAQIPLAGPHSAELEAGRQRTERGVPGTASQFEDTSLSVAYALRGPRYDRATCAKPPTTPTKPRIRSPGRCRAAHSTA